MGYKGREEGEREVTDDKFVVKRREAKENKQLPFSSETTTLFPRSQVKSNLRSESNFVEDGRKQKHTRTSNNIHTREEDDASPLYVFNTVDTIHKKPTHMSK